MAVLVGLARWNFLAANFDTDGISAYVYQMGLLSKESVEGKCK